MSEEQLAYHELEIMQEYGYLEKGTNIAMILDDYVESKKQVEPEPPTKGYKSVPNEDGGITNEIVDL